MNCAITSKNTGRRASPAIRCQSGGYGGSGYGPAPASAPQGAEAGVYLDSKAYMRHTLRLFEGLVQQAGAEVQLCHDVHERLPPREAIQFARALEPFDLFFLEDAIALEDGAWLRQLRAQYIPLAQGELFNHPLEWRTLIVEQLIDYLRIHLSQIGGITPGRKCCSFLPNNSVYAPSQMSWTCRRWPMPPTFIWIWLATNFGIQEWSGTEPPNFVIQELKAA